MLGLSGFSENSRLQVTLKWLVFLLGFIYVINCWTPLRLHVDTLRYFIIKDCIEFGCPPDSNGAIDYLPYGYTALLLGLSKLGILKSYTIVAANCIFLFGSLYFIVRIFGSSLNKYFFAVLVLLNWSSIKFVVHPLSEMQYLFFSTSSLFFYEKFLKERKLTSLAVAFILAGIAFLTRTIGVALIGALVGGLLLEYKSELMNYIKRHKIIAASLALVALVAAFISPQLGLNHYLAALGTEFGEGVGMGELLRWHFEEWGELFINAPMTKVASYLTLVVTTMIYITGGVLGIGILVRTIYLLRNRLPAVVVLYVLLYGILVFSWPFYDPRFWVPVFPFAVAIATFALLSLEVQWVRRVAWMLLVVYSSLGIFSLGYFTYTSLNNSVLANVQANGVYRNEYQTVFFGKPLDPKETADVTVVKVLERYSK